jgi:hypothetical protein
MLWAKMDQDMDYVSRLLMRVRNSGKSEDYKKWFDAYKILYDLSAHEFKSDKIKGKSDIKDRIIALLRVKTRSHPQGWDISSDELRNAEYCLNFWSSYDANMDDLLRALKDLKVIEQSSSKDRIVPIEPPSTPEPGPALQIPIVKVKGLLTAGDGHFTSDKQTYIEIVKKITAGLEDKMNSLSKLENPGRDKKLLDLQHMVFLVQEVHALLGNWLENKLSGKEGGGLLDLEVYLNYLLGYFRNDIHEEGVDRDLVRRIAGIKSGHEAVVTGNVYTDNDTKDANEGLNNVISSINKLEISAAPVDHDVAANESIPSKHRALEPADDLIIEQLGDDGSIMPVPDIDGLRIENEISRLKEQKREEDKDQIQLLEEFLKQLNEIQKRWNELKDDPILTEPNFNMMKQLIVGNFNEEIRKLNEIKRKILPELQKTAGIDKAQSALGGINLSDEHLTMNIKVDGAGMPLPVQYQDAAMMDLNGLTSIIRKISPVTPENVPALYGLLGQK